jgi:hypothetical protein
MAFNWIKCLVGILHLKPTAGCQISTLIFRFGGGGFINIPWTFVEGRQSSFPLKSKLLLGSLTDLSAWVWLCTSSPQQGVKYHLWYLDLVGDPINIPWKIVEGRQSSFTLGFISKVLSESLNDLSALVGFCTSSPQQGVKYQLWYLGLGGGL